MKRAKLSVHDCICEYIVRVGSKWSIGGFLTGTLANIHSLLWKTHNVKWELNYTFKGQVHLFLYVPGIVGSHGPIKRVSS